MKRLLDAYSCLESGERLTFDNAGEFLDSLAFIIDHASDHGSEKVLREAIALSDQVEVLNLASGDRAFAYFCISNAYASLSDLQRDISEDRFVWESEALGKQIYFLRKAAQEPGFGSCDPDRKVVIYTNLANALNVVGRGVEAREYWNRALEVNPSFGMALGNRGIGTKSYADFLYDPGHKTLFLRHALTDIESALKGRSIDRFARPQFERFLREIAAILPEMPEVTVDLDEFEIGESQPEREYRLWCLRNGLFLNPLNDLGSQSIAATDVFHLPSMLVRDDEGLQYYGFFNQLKQEYVSARYFFYEGISADGVHFADKDVTLVDTLDYPAYALATERVKSAYRLAYSLFDKVAYFINEFFELKIPERQVAFKTLWRTDRRNPGSSLRPDIVATKNWPLQGLYWLSKDLYLPHGSPLSETIEPSARELDAVRNHIEHKYFKLHAFTVDSERVPGDLFYDDLCFSMSSDDFIAKTMRVMRLARATLIYLSMAIFVGESRRRNDAKGVNFPLPLVPFDDQFKQ